MAGDCAIDTEKYSLLEDFNVDVEVENKAFETFSLCFWVYLLDSTTYPSAIIRQVHSDMSVSAPFLVLDENKKMMLLPLTLLHREAPDPVNTSSWTEVPNVSTTAKFPLQKWVHVGCEVSRNYMRLYICGELVGEQVLTSLMTNGTNSDRARKISLFSVGGDGYSVQGFIHSAEVLPSNLSASYHYTKDPPLWLSVDKPSTSGIELDEDGVWSVVSGTFCSLDVVLTNAIGQPVHKDVKVVASLLYADSGTHVEKRSDFEAFLLVSYEGIELSAEDKPCNLLNGCASFKFKLSQLSSKSDKRLFCIKFEIPEVKANYPFLETVTNQIRCISRNRDSVSSMKRIRLGEEKVSESKIVNGNGTSMEWRPQNHEEDNSSTDSENTEMRDSTAFRRYSIPDWIIFKYCLGNLTERALLLKEITNNSSDEEVSEFADQVSLYSGCSHHGYQIKMARKLIAEGTNAWNLISRNYRHVHWDNVVIEIEEHFMRIAKCSSRSLTHQDFDLLRRICGCYEYITQENFETMWCWLFPVASAVSRGLINGMWRSASPKWIEGFVTKEEAERSLQNQVPGTFILRFPTSRSWPHPDAGSVVVTYVGHDLVIHHRLLTINHICDSSERYTDAKQLQDMLLAEPELSRLGRIIRGI
ncbi:SH2 domain superfamily [Arabidopsis thaliana x Arabidopsis arenosa]|uniref:STATLA n=2 Tax=Arabidopsis TaxID=3701 RepID=A0A178WKF6_ARATH|nr:SH2 domain superfamily [Arabidopsis thaliana x Arabidopsis arenosa]KAG7646592.1 SH2 domain superfamily [Arabidopsis thaliana x Arabidopsis arenosa]OAP18810.1 STATLA [Arabidopsis thaliana]